MTHKFHFKWCVIHDIPKENIDTFRFEAGLVNNTSDDQVFSNLKLAKDIEYKKDSTELYDASFRLQKENGED